MNAESDTPPVLKGKLLDQIGPSKLRGSLAEVAVSGTRIGDRYLNRDSGVWEVIGFVDNSRGEQMLRLRSVDGATVNVPVWRIDSPDSPWDRAK